MPNHAFLADVTHGVFLQENIFDVHVMPFMHRSRLVFSKKSNLMENGPGQQATKKTAKVKSPLGVN